MDAKIIEMPQEENKIEDNLLTEEQGKEILKNIIKELNLENKNLNLDEENSALTDLASLFTILELPDEEFTLMSGIMLATLEESLNNVNDRLLLAKSLSISGLKSEDLVEVYEEIMTSLEDTLKDVYDEKRINYLKGMFSKIINAISETEGIPKRYIRIPIQRCNENAKIPSYARTGDAGMDVYALDDYEILPGETKLIPTGLKVAIPNGYELQVRPKSGRALKTKLRIANTPGTIDSGYRDEIGIIVENVEPPIKDIQYDFVRGDSDHEPDYLRIRSILYGKSYFIGKGEKFAQLVLSEVPTAVFDEIDDISIYGSDREGGFGSTGLK